MNGDTVVQGQAGPFDVALYRGHLLTREVGRELRYARTVSSTNDVALAAAAAGAEHGLVVLAGEQTRGRGRNGSTWVAPAETALLLSILVRPGIAAVEVPRLTFATAVAIALLLRDGGLAEAQVKWPNDILIARRGDGPPAGGGKIAGILCESRSQGERVEAVVVGIGLNVNQTAEELPAGATSIRAELGGEVAREPVLAELLNRFEAEYARTVSGRFEQVRADWEAMSPLSRGHPVRIESAAGTVSGLSAGLDPDGALRVVDASGATVRVVSGTARFG